jgi:hypothetical protein
MVDNFNYTWAASTNILPNLLFLTDGVLEGNVNKHVNIL